MTTSANIAGVVRPLGMIVPGRGAQPWPYGKKKVFHIDEFKPGKKKSPRLRYGQVGIMSIGRIP